MFICCGGTRYADPERERFMGLISKFEGKMEDTVEGAAERMGGASLSPVQIAKKAEKQMRREKMVGAGKQFAPTLYTILISHDDDARMFGYYPTLAGETETYLMAKAQEHGLVMDGQPLVRFIADEGLKRGKFEVIAEMVAAPLVRQLRQEEMERYGLAAPRNDGFGATPQHRQPQPQPQLAMQPQPQGAYPPPTQPVQDAMSAMPYPEAMPLGVDPAAPQAAAPLAGAVPTGAPLDPSFASPAPAAGAIAGAGAVDAGLAAAMPALNDPLASQVQAQVQPQAAAPAQPQPQPQAQPQVPAATDLEAAALPNGYVDAAIASYADGTFGDPYVTSTPAQAQPAQPQQLKAAAPAVTPQQATAAAVQPFRQAAPVTQAELFDRTNDQVFALTGAPMRIGRESARDIVVPDINASRSHAEIHQEPSGTWIIADLGSTNGTFLNGRQIKSAPLRPGDTIVIGTTELVFRSA